MTNDPFLISIPEAARLLATGRSTAYDLVNKGELRTVSIGARRLIPAEELAAYVARLKAEAGIESSAEAVAV
jgi:excisionase family DNA binding protein